MIFYLVGGEIKFLTHKVEWNERGEIHCQNFYDIEKKDAFIARLSEREIVPTVTEYDQPSAELLAMCEGKNFSSYDDALNFVDTGIVPKTQLELMQETIDALVIASLS